MTFTLKQPERWAGWAWVVLGAALALPLPLIPSFSGLLVERAWPVFLLLMGGAVCVALRLSTVSWPLGALFLWAVIRTLWMGLQIDPVTLNVATVVMEANRARPIQLLVLLALVGTLVVAAKEMPRAMEKKLAWAITGGVLIEAAFGLMNFWGLYPGMTIVQADQIGRPMGFLTHPNYWGSYMALGLPFLWALLGAPVALAVYVMIVASKSGGPVITATVGLVFLMWHRLTQAMKYAVVAMGAGVIAAVMTLHEWRLSGRWEVWEAAWPELTRYPLIGQGLGSWRVWAEHYNAKRGSFFATGQAHSEPYQLWFELGLVGVTLVAVWLVQVGLTLWKTAAPDRSIAWWKPRAVSLQYAWAAMVVMALVNALGSPTFHLPGQGALAMLAVTRVQAWHGEGVTDGNRKGRRRGH